MKPWPQIVNAALLGTQRQPFTLPHDEGPVGPFLSHLRSAHPEEALLGAAALYTQYLRAGFRPVQHEAPLPDPAAPDSQPCVSARAAYSLRRMLAGEFTEALPEWLEKARISGQRVPEELLPKLLALGAQKGTLRPAITPVIGSRGRWLARYHAPWHYAGAPMDPGLWEILTGDARLLLLQQVRATDPERARRLVQATWETENAGDRAAFLSVLQTGLNMADEPFLEGCLDDRSRKVRETAAALLARLPDSQLVGRMLARVQGLVHLKGRIRPSLSVSLPHNLDEAAQRDGIQAGKAPAPWQMGEKAWQLCQMLACIPLTTWSQQWQKSPESLLESAARSAEKEVFFAGWSLAAQRHPQREWIAALLKQGAAADILIQALPPAQREPFILALVQTKAYLNRQTLFHWLGACQQPWSLAYGRIVAEHVRRFMAHPPPLDGKVLNWIPNFARFFPPELAAEVAGSWKLHPQSILLAQPIIDGFMELLYFRRDMLAAFPGNG